MIVDFGRRVSLATSSLGSLPTEPVLVTFGTMLGRAGADAIAAFAALPAGAGARAVSSLRRDACCCADAISARLPPSSTRA
jgi:hypothetical protein